MIVFSLICLLLIGMALAFVLPPLRHVSRLAVASSTADANLAVYRRQLAEIERDLHHRTMTPEQFEGDRAELEQRLIADLPDDSRAGGSGRTASSGVMLVYALAIGVPLTAVALYLMLGTPPSFLQSR